MVVIGWLGLILVFCWPVFFILDNWDQRRRVEKLRRQGEVLEVRDAIIEAAQEVVDVCLKYDIGMPPELADAIQKLGDALAERRNKKAP